MPPTRTSAGEEHACWLRSSRWKGSRRNCPPPTPAAAEPVSSVPAARESDGSEAKRGCTTLQASRLRGCQRSGSALLARRGAAGEALTRRRVAATHRLSARVAPLGGAARASLRRGFALGFAAVRQTRLEPGLRAPGAARARCNRRETDNAYNPRSPTCAA